MLHNLTILKKIKIIKSNGTYEWLLVRCSGVLILLYVIYLLCFIFSTSVLSYEEWHDFFSKKTTKIFNLITLFFILIHSWIGISHVLVDYIKNILLKRVFKFIIVTIFFMYLFCGINVIWST